jgi:tRNA 2-selenouridine synthase
MPVEKIHIKEFLQLSSQYPVLDVRSPAEYNHAHIPGAYNLPLFTNEERKVVGTTYKQQSREAAIKIGLDFFGPKMRKMVEDVESLVGRESTVDGEGPMAEKEGMANGHRSTANNSFSAIGRRASAIILVHCWRGGMRSAGVAWLLDLYGFKVFTLAGGYKAYRNYVLETLRGSYNFKILGGYTGSGKTIVLKKLEKKGERIIDLEGIACHRGSAFGAIGQPLQPSQEMFENLLGHELRKETANAGENGSPDFVWLEDESQRIGLINIPQALWQQIRQSAVYFLDIPFEERLNYVVECYGKLDKEKMVNAIIRIRKRLGGLETKSAINYLLENDSKECFRILLKYYDRYYLKGLKNRDHHEELIKNIPCEKVDAAANAEKILTHHKFLMTTKTLNHE